MEKITLALLLLPLVSFSQSADQQLDRTISTIAFGSCSHQSKVDQQLWEEVNAAQPDLWIWLGDNIYGDTEDMQTMRQKYDLQKSHLQYQELLQDTEVLGIWDDHDYGVNDGGKEYAAKDASRQELFRFLDVSSDNPARKRKGAYQSYAFKSGEVNTKVILLDARYFRDPLMKDENNWNIQNSEGEILGNAQWEWFEEQLQDASIDLFIVGSGIQVLPEEHRFEKWANFPKERARILATLSKVEKPLVLLSGDRHISEVSQTTVEGYPYPLVEFTSSSLTNPWGEPREEPNRYRTKEIIYEANFAVLSIEGNEESLELQVRYVGQQNKELQAHSIRYEY